MTRRLSPSGSKTSSSHSRVAHVAMLLVLITTLFASGLGWLVPVEVVQQWAYDRAGAGTFEKFEAVGEAEFSLWLWRTAFTLLLILVGSVWSDFEGWVIFGKAVTRGLADITTFGPLDASGHARARGDRLRTIGFRGFLIAWGLLFFAHAAHGVGLRIHDWPYFRFNPGDVVLPNISDSNRAVIRYLREATPPEARILVASDQKLFFLSYYLRPRTLLHRMHPESEHVIPLKDQQRKLLAYRLEDLTSDDLKEMPHEYTLEYFEHPDFVDRSHVLDDSAWVSFLRRYENNSGLIPAYLVRLRRTEGGRP